MKPGCVCPGIRLCCCCCRCMNTISFLACTHIHAFYKVCMFICGCGRVYIYGSERKQATVLSSLPYASWRLDTLILTKHKIYQEEKGKYFLFPLHHNGDLYPFSFINILIFLISMLKSIFGN